MKYVSIDIETLGLNPDAPIIEVACVFVENGECLGEEQTYVCHDSYDNCEPYAMAMHPETLKIIADGPQEGTINIDWVGQWLAHFLDKYGFYGKITFAGKNAAKFDIPMLQRQSKSFDRIKPHHRVLDPGSMYVRRGDDEIQSLSTILESQGLDGTVSHTALDDARAVVAAVERFFNNQEELRSLRYLAREAEALGDELSSREP